MSPAGATSGITVAVEMSSDQARIQDLLRIFVKANPPPMSGATRFRAKDELPPGRQPFKKRVMLDREFATGGGYFTNRIRKRL